MFLLVIGYSLSVHERTNLISIPNLEILPAALVWQRAAWLMFVKERLQAAQRGLARDHSQNWQQ